MVRAIAPDFGILFMLMNWQNQLIFFPQRPQYEILRISPNSNPNFTDEEALTAYAYRIFSAKKTVKQIHIHFESYLKAWFLALPKYEAFNYIINFLEQEFLLVFYSKAKFKRILSRKNRYCRLDANHAVKRISFCK